MTLKTRLAILFGIVALCLAAPRGVVANGMEFFDAENDGEVLLYYFGNVKDTKGAPVDKFMVTVTAKNAGPLNMPFRNDTPGHFRSPDVGKAIKGLGKPVDPRFIEVTVKKDGYRVVKAPKVPDKQGAVELEGFVLEPVPGGK